MHPSLNVSQFHPSEHSQECPGHAIDWANPGNSPGQSPVNSIAWVLPSVAKNVSPGMPRDSQILPGTPSSYPVTTRQCPVMPGKPLVKLTGGVVHSGVFED